MLLTRAIGLYCRAGTSPLEKEANYTKASMSRSVAPEQGRGPLMTSLLKVKVANATAKDNTEDIRLRRTFRQLQVIEEYLCNHTIV